MLDSRSNKFVSEEINELIKEMKKILFEMTEIKFKLKNFEKINLLKEIEVFTRIESDVKNNPLGSSEILLILDRNSQTFLMKHNVWISDKSKYLELSIDKVSVLLEKYAEIIISDKIEYHKQKEKEESLKNEESRKVEDEKAKKEQEFNNFFDM